jgi:hypothetical protein
MLTRPDHAAVLEDVADLKGQLAAARYRDDVWAWISECVTTVDELDARTPIKPFPTRVCVRCSTYEGGVETTCIRCGDATRPLIYLRELAHQWQSAKPPLLVVPKARRMKLSWLFVACHVWGALHWPHAKVFFVSSKEEKSGELVERAHGILSRLPPHGGGGRLVGQTASPPQCGWITEPLLSGWRRGRRSFASTHPQRCWLTNSDTGCSLARRSRP